MAVTKADVEWDRIVQEKNAEIERLDADNARLQAERDSWEAVCSGSIKEQFRLARENEARLKLALEQLDKAAAEIERLKNDKDVQRSQDRNAAYEAEIEQLRADMHLRDTRHRRSTE